MSGPPALAWRSVTVEYADAVAPVLREVDLEIPEAELVLVAGGTGSGKWDTMERRCGVAADDQRVEIHGPSCLRRTS